MIKIGEVYEKKIHRKNMQTGNRHEKIPDPLVVKEMQNQTPIRHHAFIYKTGKINSIDIKQSWENWQKLSYECKFTQSFWKDVWQ